MDVIDSPVFNKGFEDREVRRKFIFKVYTLLLLQLFLSCTVICISIFVPPVRAYLRNDLLILICSGLFGVICFMALSCVRRLRVRVPINYIVLTLLTLGMALFMGSLSAKKSTLIVLSAMGLTAAVVIFLTLLATSPCFDITGYAIYLLVGTIVVVIVSIIVIILAFVLRMPVLFMVYGGLGALLYSAFIVFDTQMILGGKKYEISPEEYILGTVTLFVDIVGLFMMLLTLLSGGQQ